MSETADDAPELPAIADFGLFDVEERIAAESEQMATMLHEAAEKLKFLSEVYRKSLREQRRLVRLSDRTQLELQVANHNLVRQAAELKRLNEALQEEVTRREALTAELHRQVATDVLTGTASRRHFFSLARNQLEDAQRHGIPLSVLLIDMDHFKQINDRFGHSAGDRVLEHFGTLCKSLLRDEDLIGRLGGEEFAVLLHNTPLDEARNVAARLINAVEEALVVTGPANHTGYSISIGITQVFEEEPALDDALARADRALYLAKQSGRGCFRVYQDGEPFKEARFRTTSSA